jgi:hypothetical protein
MERADVKERLVFDTYTTLGENGITNRGIGEAVGAGRPDRSFVIVAVAQNASRLSLG